MRRAINAYLGPFLAVLGLMVLAAGTATYILSQQNFRFPLVEDGPFRVQAELASARAVAPGQGQSVRVAGVKIGDIGDVELEDGRAVVTLEIEQRFKHLVRTDSTALLRPKTGLKDMFLELDPGHGRPLDEDDRIEIADTAPDVDLDEVLGVLDEDGRDYLKLLISGAGKGIDGRGADMREALKRLGPTVRDSARVTRASAARRRELRSLVRHYGLLTRELGRSDRDIVRLVRGSNAVFGSIAPEERALSRSVAELPGTLRTAESTLVKAGALGRRLEPALQALRPSIRKLGPTGEALLPLAREATPILRDRIRPLARVGRTELEELGVGARRVARAAPGPAEGAGAAEPAAEHAGLQPGRRRGPDRRPGQGPRPPGGLPLLAGVERPERHHRVRDLRRPGRVPPLHLRQHQLHRVQRDRHPHRGDRRAGRGAAVRGVGSLMVKQAPTFGKVMAMVVFALSCVGIVLYLWLTFGGSIPLRPESYRFEAKVQEAATLPVEADVRVAGVTVGKVKRKELSAGDASTLLEIEMKPEYAPIRRDSRLIVRQKTLLGETYVELAPGRSDDELADGGRLSSTQVEPTVELDEVFSAFDRPTRTFFQRWVKQVDRAVSGRRGQDLNDSLGSLAGFTVDGERLFRVLDERRGALQRLVRDGGTVLEAIDEREGALRGLVSNSSEALRATASRDDALADTVRILPTFLDESRATLRRVERFSGDTRPLVRDLLPAANDLGPTLRDLRDVSPDLRATFRSLDPLIRAGRTGVPALARTVRGAGPVVEALNPFLDELNPVLSLLGFYQTRISGFLTNGGSALNGDFGGERYAPNTVLFESRSFERYTERPEFDRGHVYLPPNEFNRIQPLGGYDSPDCSKAIGSRNRYGDVPPNDALTTPAPAKEQLRRPVCFTSGPNLYDGTFYPRLQPGKAPVLKQLGPLDGIPPATQDRPEGPK